MEHKGWWKFYILEPPALTIERGENIQNQNIIRHLSCVSEIYSLTTEAVAPKNLASFSMLPNWKIISFLLCFKLTFNYSPQS